MKLNPAKTAERLRRASILRPSLAIVLGSGFQGILDSVSPQASVEFGDLPGFPRGSVPGHGRQVVFGELGVAPVLLLTGRAHFYEGFTLEEVTFPIRVLAEFGIRALLLTNAAGGINPRFRAGDFMQLTDHINLMGANPLRGVTALAKERFVDLSAVYDRTLNRWLAESARKERIRLHAGVYLAVSGPSYETPAEIRAFATLGADAVGMSTVPEAIVARQCGLAVAAVSCITNAAAGLQRTPLSHQEVLDTADRVRAKAVRLLDRFAMRYGVER
jgi:purine-nucleoside phosphorylase